MSAPLSSADVGFVLLVAARRFAAGSVPDGATASAVSAAAAAEDGPEAEGAYRRAAAVAAEVLRRRPPARHHAALLVLCAQLRADGYGLMAPQGAVVGMIEGLDGGRMRPSEVVRWIEDRALQLG